MTDARFAARVAEGSARRFGRAALLAAVAALPMLVVLPVGPVAAQQPAAMVASDGPVIGVRVGTHPGYGRVVFDWPTRTGYEAVTRGDDLVIRFAAPGQPRIGGIIVPRNVTGLSAEDGAVRISAREGARFRHFLHGPKLVVDILDPEAPVTAAAAPEMRPALTIDPAPSTEGILADLAGATGIPVPGRAASRAAVLASATPGPEAVRAAGIAPDVLPRDAAPAPATIQMAQALPPGGPRPSAPFNVPMQAPPPGISLIPQAQAQTLPTQIPGVPQVVAPAPGATLTRPLVIEQGAGRLVELPAAALTVLVADPRIARVQPASPTSLFIMGVNAGRTNLIATREDGSLVAEFDITVQSSGALAPQAIAPAAVPTVTAGQVQSMIRRMVRGGQNVRVSIAGRTGAIQLSGMVPSAADAQRAEAIAKSMAGESREVINDLTLLSGIQVNLRVRVAEISREVTRDLGFNWLAAFNDGTWQLGLRSGSVVGTAVAALADPLGRLIPGLASGAGTGTGGTYGVRYANGNWDINGLIDALAQDRLVTILAEPNLTAQSGEVASFLAGGEFPVPAAAANNSTTLSVEYKPYGVSLAFVPTVLSPERMNMRVRPEVSELSETGSISFPVAGGVVSIPGLTVRRAETTIELGSGQSFAIAGLLSRNASINNSGVSGLGDIPVLGALFRSDRFRRAETELVIIITPYLVRPVSDPSALGTPLDTFRPATDLERVLLRRQTGSGAPYRQIRPPSAAGFIVE
ncbi:pilus assembly protein N-terminal domain-containing protein [Roseomonas sp. HJA6]|uniref:Pilus assembly protein N-terminal domain-containing protein n=1 Tax=Roseomonas alba TaxID=2846776 RepID=A0ABS7A3D2_9PROT|nr:pilus assembly protein N-terminal domain-containing protein [Neoroseomonas alba]MBW6396806.1 pilus assembly protein N-terminal domain-containing protein [Neoroseomonas alba]